MTADIIPICIYLLLAYSCVLHALRNEKAQTEREVEAM